MLSSDDSSIHERKGLIDLGTHQEVDAMSNPDFFLANGCSISDEEHGFEFILGNNNIFAFDHQKITFKKIEC